MPLPDGSGGLGGLPPRPANVPGALAGASVTPGVSLGQVLARRVVVEGINGAVLVYATAPPVLGNLIASVSSGGFKDAVGNLVLQGNVSYEQALSNLFFANAIVGGDLAWYKATSASGPWTLTAQLSVNTAGSVLLQTGTSSGAWPQAGGAGITTVAQVVAALEAMGLLTP
jgi:hypothetical protein